MSLTIQPPLIPAQPQVQAPGVQANDAQPQVAPAQAAVNPAQIAQVQQQGAQAIAQRPLRELGPAISTDQQILEQATARWAQGKSRLRTLPKTMTLRMPPQNNAVQIDSKMFKREIKALPRNQRQAAIADMPRVMQERVNNGHRIWTEVSAGNLQGPATMEDVRDLMTFLTAKAMEKGDGFSEGALSIADPDNRLREFLDSCPETYQRSSSHLEGFQNAGGAHRGIDAHAGISLPYGKGSLVYGSMNADAHGLKGDRLFLTMKEHGQTLAHVKGFFRAVLRGVSGGILFPMASHPRSERIPVGVSQAFKAVLKTVDRFGQAEVGAILRQNNPLNPVRGIRTMVANLDEALAQENLPEATRNSLQELRNNLATHFDHLDVRIGHEVVLSQDELTGTSPLDSTTNLMRATIKSLLSVADAPSMTSARAKHYAQQLAQAAANIAHLADNQTPVLLGQAMAAATEHLSEDQRHHLAALLNTPELKGIERALRHVRDMDGAPLGAMDDQSRREAISASYTMSQLHVLLRGHCEVGYPADTPPRNQDMALVRPILVATGREAVLSRTLELARATRTSQAQLAQQAAGLMRMGDARLLAGPGTLAVGQVVEAIPRGEVNREAIGRHMLKGLQEDLDIGPDAGATSLGGMALQFVKDFLRNGIVVNGEFMGRQHSGTSLEEQEAEVGRFIDAVGGQARALQISRLAHQGRLGDATAAFSRDPGLGPLFMNAALNLSRSTFPISPHTGEPANYILSVQTQGERATITIDWSEQRLPFDQDSHELGTNASMTFTLEGLGTQNRAVQLDDWDALFSSTPRRRIAEMDQAHLPADQFAIDPRTQDLIADKPPVDRDAITRHLSAALTAELQEAKRPDYRGLPYGFVVDFYRNPKLVVDGQPHGVLGSVHDLTEEQKHALLDAFIDAVGGDEDRARHIATMAYQNMPLLFDLSIETDEALGALEVAHKLHEDNFVARLANFTITTQQDGSVDIRLDYHQQRGPGQVGYEIGKNGFLDFRLSNLDTEAPTVQLQRWDMHYGTNAPRE